MPFPVIWKETVQCLVWGIARLLERDGWTVCAAGVWKEHECEKQVSTSTREIQTCAKPEPLGSPIIIFLPLFLVFVQFIPHVLRNSAPRTSWGKLLFVFTELTFPLYNRKPTNEPKAKTEHRDGFGPEWSISLFQHVGSSHLTAV